MKPSARKNASQPNPQSLKRKTWQFFLMILLVFMVCFLVSFSIIITRTAVDNEISESEIALTSIGKNLDVSLDRYKEMSRLIMLNANVVGFLRGYGEENAYNPSTVVDGVFSITNIYNYVDSVYIYHDSGAYVSTGSGVMLIDETLMHTAEWQERIEAAKGGNVMMINGDGVFNKKTGLPIITMGRQIYDIDTQEPIGSLYVNLTPSVFSAATRDLSDSRQICFFDKEGNVLSGDAEMASVFRPAFTENGFSYEVIRNGTQRQILSAYSTEDVPVVLVSLSDVTHSSAQYLGILWIAIPMIVLMIMAIFSSGVFISSNIARPIDQLTEAMTSTRVEGELKEINLSLPNNEIRNLADSYNGMIRHIHRLIEELMEKEKSVRKAEMRTLQEQIKPHFLYNAIGTISYLAHESHAPKVHDALETLGSFYRNFLSKGSREIPLRNEILIVKDYLTLQKLRYGDAFDVEYEIDESVLDTLIPKLVLQPLVENSVNHGVRLKGEKGIIRISAFEKEGDVHISVFDTGVGMSQRQIDKVLAAKQADADALSGFGLKGTIERIRYYFNYKAAINIKSTMDEYTEIEIIIPNQYRRGLDDV
ncbi:MAG: sensor histidine kinase [Eubacteriales bacterium]